MGFVSAAPPFLASDAPNGFFIESEIPTYHQQDTHHNFVAHVFNYSNGIPITHNISCYFHLYNVHGNHVAEMYDSTVDHNFDFEFAPNAKNFSTLGSMSYIIQCNNSVAGGFLSAPFQVTPCVTFVLKENQTLDRCCEDLQGFQVLRQ